MNGRSISKFILSAAVASSGSAAVSFSGNHSDSDASDSYSLGLVDFGSDQVSVPIGITGDHFEISVPEAQIAQEWTPKLDATFRGLVLKKALGKISDVEARELKSLSSRRCSLLAPQTGEEVLQEAKERELMERILKLVHEHARITSFRTSSSTKDKAKARA